MFPFVGPFWRGFPVNSKSLISISLCRGTRFCLRKSRHSDSRNITITLKSEPGSQEQLVSMCSFPHYSANPNLEEVSKIMFTPSYLRVLLSIFGCPLHKMASFGPYLHNNYLPCTHYLQVDCVTRTRR